MSSCRFGFFLFFFVVCCSVHASAGGMLRKVSFLPHWIPQAQFAGYYVALEKGFYRNHGIDLTIQAGGHLNPSEDALQKGTTDFATMWLVNAVKLRIQGVPVVNVAQLVRRSAIMLVAKKSSGIASPADMNGKKIGVWDDTFQIQLSEFIRQHHLKVRIIYQPFSINLFLRGGVDLTTAMWYNEYNTIINSGLNEDELNTFFFADYNLNFPEDGIYCREELLKKDPELCRSFVLASLEGWRYAFDHPEEAVRIIVKYSQEANVSVNIAHQQWMLDRMSDLMVPKGHREIPTALSEKDFRFVVDKLFENGTIKRKPSYSELFRPVIQ